jgi:hypothetical protein
MTLAAAGTEVASASAATVTVEPGHYRVEVKMVSVPQDAAKEISDSVHNAYYSDGVIAHLLNSPSTTVLSCPVVEAAATSPATITVTRNVIFSGKSREVGIKFSVTPDTKADPGSRYLVAFSNVRFDGFADTKASQPIFDTQRLSTSMIQFIPPSPGYCCFNLRKVDQVSKTYDADGRQSASVADAHERQLLFVKITRG